MKIKYKKKSFAYREKNSYRKQQLMNNLLLRSLGNDNIVDIPTDYRTACNEQFKIWGTLYSNREVSQEEYIYLQLTDPYIKEAVENFMTSISDAQFMTLNHLDDDIIGIVLSKHKWVL